MIGFQVEDPWLSAQLMKIKSATAFFYLVIICILASMANCSGLQRTNSPSNIFSNDHLPEERFTEIHKPVLGSLIIGLMSLSAYNFYSYVHPALLVSIAVLAYFGGPEFAAQVTAGISVFLTFFSLLFSLLSSVIGTIPSSIICFLGMFWLSLPAIASVAVPMGLWYLEMKKRGRI